MRILLPAIVVLCAAPAIAQAPAGHLKTATEVLNRYKQVLGGTDAIQKVRSETVRGEIEGTGISGKVTFVYYAKPFKNLIKLTMPDGAEIQSGFDGTSSWTINPKGASLDKDTPVESVRRDADLQYALHQPDYFKTLEFAGVTDFEGHHCYWLHGTTHWGKDNNQFYDINTGLLAGYRFQADDGSGKIVVAIFDDYKNFGGPLVATKNTHRVGDHFQTFIYQSVSYNLIPDSMFELPPSIKALMK